MFQMRRNGTGTVLDSPDLAEKYKGKTDQLQNVRQNTRCVSCPTCVCNLYEDRHYQSSTAAEETHTKKRKLELSTEQTIKGMPKAKAIKNQLTAVTEGGHQTMKISEKQQKQLNEWSEFLKLTEENLRALYRGVIDYGLWIAPIINENLSEVMHRCGTSRGQCNAINDTGECTDFPGFMRTMAEFKKEYNKVKSGVEAYVKLSLIHI